MLSCRFRDNDVVKNQDVRAWKKWYDFDINSSDKAAFIHAVNIPWKLFRLSLVIAAPKYFLSYYFAVPKFCYTFVAVNELAISYQGNGSMQGILKFFASFCAECLVNPNNLLTHTHTGALSVQPHFFAFAYTHAKRDVSPINKGLGRVPFVRFLPPFTNMRKR